MNKAIYIFDEPKGCVNCQFYKWEESENPVYFGDDEVPCYISVCTLLRKEVLPIEDEYESTKDPNCPLMIFRSSDSGKKRMSYLEVIKDIQRLKIDSVKESIRVLKRAVPREVKYDLLPNSWVCPSCEKPVKKTDLYCRRCGQALKEKEKYE